MNQMRNNVFNALFLPILFYVPAQCIKSISRAINFFVTEGLIATIMIKGLSYFVSDRKIVKNLNPSIYSRIFCIE